MKALAAVSLLPSSTYTVKVPTETKVGMAFSRKLLKVCTRKDFQRVSSSVFLTFWMRSQKGVCRQQTVVRQASRQAGRRQRAEGRRQKAGRQAR